VPWQAEQAHALNEAAGCGERVCIIEGDYEDAILPRASYDGVYALESSCHAHGADKGVLLAEAHRLLRPGGRTAFLTAAGLSARCRSASTANCASAGSSKSWRAFSCSRHGWSNLAFGRSESSTYRCEWRLRLYTFPG
jgi:SAM-dependent methyltransferase